MLARLMIAVSLIVAASAVAWAYQLQQEAQEAARLMADYEARISDLEDRLSDTDESVSQSSVAMQVKIKELYSEVDKLWASAWRRNKANIADNKKGVDANKAALDKQVASIDSIQKDAKTADIRMTALAGQLEEVGNLLDPMQELLASAPSDRAQLERLADRLHKLDLEVKAMNQRVDTSAEDIEAINGFRRQVWGNLNEIQQALAEMRGGSAPPQ